MSAQNDDQYDDVTLGLQVQQFFDEWHYRLLASGMAGEWDRQTGLLKALDLFEVCGMILSADERDQLVNMEETQMVQELVKKMPLSLRKTIGHFLLQLQLVLSTATRVRGIIEEGSAADVAKVMEDGDAGIAQQILKQAVIEASIEIGSLNEIKTGWEKCMTTRVSRLSKCASEADVAASELARTQVQLNSFAKDQNAKARGVLGNMSAGQASTFAKTIFGAWAQWLIKYKSEKDIHDKFRKEIEDLNKEFLDYKQKQLDNVRNVLNKSAAGGNSALLAEVCNLWRKEVVKAKEDAAEEESLKAASDRLGGMKAAGKDNAKKALLKMTAGTDNALLDLCQEAWHNLIILEKKNAEENAALKATQDKLDEFKKSKGDQAGSVIQRFQGASDLGLISSVFAAWNEETQASLKGADMEAQMKSANDRFASLNGRQKGAANGCAARSGDMLDENTMIQIFLSWATEAKVERVYAHYSGKLEGKKQKMEAVQGMFKRFADQLEQGIQSPRSQRKQAGAKALPPQMP